MSFNNQKNNNSRPISLQSHQKLRKQQPLKGKIFGSSTDAKTPFKASVVDSKSQQTQKPNDEKQNK